MTAPRSAPIHLGRPRSARNAVAACEHPLAPGRAGIVDVSRPVPSWRWRVVAADGLWLVGIAWSVPFAVLIVGTPIALAIIALLWAGRSAFGAF